VFGLLFYVFFYCWTLALAGLSIAFLLDLGARRVYGATLCIGGVIGLPQLLYSIHLNHLLSAEAMRRFGLFTPAPRLYENTVPTLSLLALAATAWWIWKSRRFDLLYAWSLVAGGILLSRSRVISGICFHEYHYDWLWTPIRGALVLIVAMIIVNVRFRWRPAAAAICWTLLMLYLAGGVYLAAICVTRTWSGVEQVRNYTRYKTQRMAGAVKPLAPGATIAGDDGFCQVAAVAKTSGYSVVRRFCEAWWPTTTNGSRERRSMHTCWEPTAPSLKRQRDLTPSIGSGRAPSASRRCLTHSCGNMTKWFRTRIDLLPNLAFGTWRSRRTRPTEAICARVGRCFSRDRTGKSGRDPLMISQAPARDLAVRERQRARLNTMED
jgi:hypothetical protein